MTEEYLRRCEHEACPACGPQIDNLCDQVRKLYALMEDVLQEIENTGDYQWWHGVKADYKAVRNDEMLIEAP